MPNESLQPGLCLSSLRASSFPAKRRRAVVHLLALAMLLISSPAFGQLNPFGRRPDTTKATNVSPNVKRVGTRMTGFGIPFSIQNPENKFVEVQLFMSKNRGLTWQFYARQNLDAKEIPFEASGDGEYWFCLKTLDRNRQLQPTGNPNVELIVVVDTIMPEVDFRVQTDPAGRVVCRWKADDQNIDPTTVKLSYRSLLSANDAENTWVDVPYKAVETAKNGTFSDQYAFWGDAASREMVVRLIIADMGGNEVLLERQIMSPRMTATGAPTAANAAPATVPSRTVGYNAQRPVLPPPDMPLPTNRSEPAQTQSQTPKGFFTPNQRPAAPANADPNCPDGNCPPKKPGLLGNWNLWKKEEAPAPPPASLPATAFAAPAKPAEAKSQLANSSTTKPPAQLPSAQKPVGNGFSAAQSPALQANFASPSAGQENTRQPNSNQPASPLGPITSNLHQPDATSGLYGDQNAVALPPQTPSLTNPTNQAANNAAGVAWPSRSLAADGQVTNQGTALPFNLGDSPRMSIGLGSTTVPGIAASQPTIESLNVASQPAASFLAASNQPAPLLPPESSEQVPGVAPPMPLNAIPASAALHREELPNEAAGTPASTSPPNSVLSPAPLPIAPAPRDPNANTLSVGSQRFRLNYENSHIDPALIKSVILWMTTDGGQSWSSYGEDADLASPFPVQVEREGTYGFRIVYETNDGVMGRAPARGDQPDICVHVDVTPPAVQLVSAPYGRGAEAGALVVNWKAEDFDLGPRPITIAWSRTAEGPWTTIVNGHPNTGTYAWRIDAQVPDRIFLRLEVTDAAGNQTVTQTSRPLELDGLAPRGRILSVDPVK